MIKSMGTNSGPWLQVNGYSNTPYFSPNAPSAGLVRYNGSNQSVEVYDGNVWHNISSHADVSLTPEAQELLAWAREKREEERVLKERMDKHPGLKDAWERFEIMKQLCLDEEKS